MEGNEQRRFEDNALLDKKLAFFVGLPRILLAFPRFLKQRKRLLDSPYYALKPPKDFDGWLEPEKFLRRNLLYIAVLGAGVKGVEWIVGGESRFVSASKLVEYGQFIIPTVLLILLLMIKGLMYVSLPDHRMDQVWSDFQKVYYTNVISYPF